MEYVAADETDLYSVLSQMRVYLNELFTHHFGNQYTAFVLKHNLTPIEQAVLLCVAFYLFIRTLGAISCVVACIEKVYQKGLKASIFKLLITYIPFAKRELEKQTSKIQRQLETEISHLTDKEKFFQIPQKGLDQVSVSKKMNSWAVRDDKLSFTGKISGSRYDFDAAYEKEVSEVSKNFLYHNPLHYDLFPAGRQMEAEVIRMTCDMFGSKDGFGLSTSGGTESILMGVLAHRNYAAKYKGIKKPNIVMPITAHPAFNKACNYFKIECIKAPVDKNSQVIVKEVAKRINKNTIMLVGSVPNFPHGAIDPIPELAKLAKSKKIGMHVDCCLGGFVVAFAKDYNLDIPAFDFNVEGVTSISCDHHKYGLAPKGISVCMFKTNELRKCCYTSVSDWPGGFYATPTVSGSKGGAAMAGAWYAMMVHGREGYVEKSKTITGAVRNIAKQIKTDADLQEIDVIGNPKTCVVGLVYKNPESRNIYHLEGALSKKGWHFSGIQKPAAIHISMTHGIAAQQTQLISDLKECLKDVAANPEKYKDCSSASVYGASFKVPDTNIIDNILMMAVDCYLRI